MPLLIRLKEPPLSLIFEGEVKDTAEAVREWDEIFHGQTLQVKTATGKNTILPLLRECNIAFIQEVTDREVKEMEIATEKRRKQIEAQGGKGSIIDTPQFFIPSRRGGRG